LDLPYLVAVDRDESLYSVDQSRPNPAVWKIDATGRLRAIPVRADDQKQFFAQAMTVDGEGNVYISSPDGRIFRVAAADCNNH
jgi:sugar lactone lactonase YvrE